MKYDVIVIGGGIIGATCAFDLAKNGYHTAIIEKKHCGAGASGHSAAMLECQTDSHRGEPFITLAKSSLYLFPHLYNHIKSITGIDFQFEKKGILVLAENQEETILIQNEVTRQNFWGLKARWLKPDQLMSDYPNVGDGFEGAAHFQEDGQLSGEKFLAAMVQASRIKGVSIYENATVSKIEKENGKVTRVISTQGDFEADHIVLASGAWSDLLLGNLGFQLGIEPIRGQLAVFDSPAAMIECPLYTKTGGYVTPKKDGSTFVGSTVENVGFDESTTQEAKRELLKKAQNIYPALSPARFRGMTAGLRPGSPDMLPFLGALPNIPNLFMATGHSRNGILLAPITARIITQLIQKKLNPRRIGAFLPERLLSPVV